MHFLVDERPVGLEGSTAHARDPVRDRLVKSGPVSALLAFCETGAHESKPPRQTVDRPESKPRTVDRPAKLANMSIVKIGHFEVNLGRKLGEGGFGAALANRYRRHADVLLRGYSGYNSRDAVALLKHVFPLDDPTPPVLVTVCFGANDAVKETSAMADVQGCPLPEYAEMTTSLRPLSTSASA